MKKKFVFGLVILSTVFLIACGNNSSNLTTQTTTESPTPSNKIEGDESSSSESVSSEPSSTATLAPTKEPTPEPTETPTEIPTETPTPKPSVGSRSNTPYCLIPSADGSIVYTSDVSSLDTSNANEGYIIANYFGTSEKVKLRITGSDAIVYTYDLHGGNEVFPLSAGSGSYDLAVFENIGVDQYSTAQYETVSVSLTNTFGPFLYPNQYVTFNSASACVAKAKTLVVMANNDLDAVSSIYNYIINNITYDYGKATTVQSGYLPNPDTLLTSKTGICLDYASLMVAMLRSQRIPARLEVGYVGTAYHAWISTYIKDVGWVNGIIEFDGTNWKLMDPTFAASTPGEDLENFIGDGSSYLTKYIY